MSDKIILEELYKNEAELMYRLIATRNAILGFGGEIKNILIDLNNNNQIFNEKHLNNINKDKDKVIEKVETKLGENYNSNWNWENKIIYALQIINESDVDQITNFIIEKEPLLDKKKVKNAIGVRASKMKKARMLNYKLSTFKNRRHKHIYSLI